MLFARPTHPAKAGQAMQHIVFGLLALFKRKVLYKPKTKELPKRTKAKRHAKK